MLKDIFDNDKLLAIFAIAVISCWAMSVMGVSAKDIIIPAITGICGFVTGSKTAKTETVSQVEETSRVDVAKITAAKESEAAKTEGEKQ
jgi:fluoride ion exporter CrcB/FEX